MYRKTKIEQAKREHFDVAIIGGGITGAGIFLRCCQKGLKTILIDVDDFAAGTSSRSAKMIHGGLRYLQYLQVKLVKEALKERENLLQLYPHLVKPLPFLMPIYDSRFAIAKMKIGLTGYDKLASSSILPKHKLLGPKEIEKQYPMLKRKGLNGGFYYYDAFTNDARLTNEVIMQGCEMGGIALNYVGATLMNRTANIVTSISCTDQLNEEEFHINANHFISAAGVWTDEILVMMGKKESNIMLPSKGVHLVVDGKQFPEREVLLIPCEDKRFIWICPWVDGMVIIGATDTPYYGNFREPGTTSEDIDYLLRSVNHSLEGIQLSEKDILSVFSGLRPLLNEEGESDSVKVSRDYKIWWEQENLLMIAGGKLTSFLSMADHILESLRSKIKWADSNDNQLQRKTTSNQSIGNLAEKWGPCAGIVAAILQENIINEQRIIANLEYQFADVIFYIRHQNAEKISDVLTRRMTITYRMTAIDTKLVAAVADVMQQELKWTNEVKTRQIEDYGFHWNILHSWGEYSL